MISYLIVFSISMNLNGCNHIKKKEENSKMIRKIIKMKIKLEKNKIKLIDQ